MNCTGALTSLLQVDDGSGVTQLVGCCTPVRAIDTWLIFLIHCHLSATQATGFHTQQLANQDASVKVTLDKTDVGTYQQMSCVGSGLDNGEYIAVLYFLSLRVVPRQCRLGFGLRGACHVTSLARPRIEYALITVFVKPWADYKYTIAQDHIITFFDALYSRKNFKTVTYVENTNYLTHTAQPHVL
jgi:hypothetical protein